MNGSNWVHVLYTVALQGLLFLMLDDPWIGGVAGAMFFWGREVAQRQQHIEEMTGVNVPDQDVLDAFDLTQWGRDGLLDALAPSVAAVVAALILGTL